MERRAPARPSPRRDGRPRPSKPSEARQLPVAKATLGVRHNVTLAAQPTRNRSRLQKDYN